MQITRVELKNIKNHAEAEWAFSPGVIAICGPNGSGKTTIIEAIAWALFDHLDYKREDFVKRGEKKGQVVVGFISTLDEREYIVQRDTSGNYFIYDPTTKTRLVEQKNQVVPWLCQHIGVDPGADLATLFKTTIGVPQGTFTYDFTLRPSERKGVFDRILKVDEYREASDNLRTTLKHIEGQITEADRGIASAEGELKVYDETRREFEELTARARQLGADLEAVQSQAERLSSELASLDQLQRQIEEQHTVCERLEVRLRVTRDKLTSAREAADQAQAAAALVAAAQPGYENYLVAAQCLDELDRDRQAREALRAQISDVERTQIETRAQMERIDERLAEISAARIDLDGLATHVEEQRRLDAQLASLRESRGARQSLERRIGQLDEELERLRKRYSNISKDLEKAEKNRAQAEGAAALEEEREALDRLLGERELAFKSRRLKQTHLDGQQRDLTRLEEESVRAAKELARLETLAATARHLTSLETELQGQNDRLAQLRAETARDAEMISALESGGVCPLLSEKCLNLKPGESLDGRFRAGLTARRQEITRLESQLPAAASELVAAQRASAEAARLPQVQRESEQLGQRVRTQREQVMALSAEIGANEMNEAAEINDLRQRRGQVDAKLREARQAQQALAEAEGLRRALDDLKEEGGEKKKLHDAEAARLRDFADLETRLRETEEALAALADPRGRATALRAQIDRAPEWERARGEGERRSAEVTTRHQQLTAELNGYAALDAELATASLTRAVNEKDYRTYIANEQSAATVAARQREAAEIAAAAAEIELSFADAQKEQARLAGQYDRERQARTRIALDESRQRATQFATQLEHAREQHGRIEKQLAYLDEVRVRMREHLAAHDKFTRLSETADFIRDILQKAAPYLTESYVFSVSIEANQLYREITGRPDVTLRWTRDYEIVLEEEGRERPFGNLSGGEQMAAALAVRLALLKELSEVNLAFFDEPTTNMDEERRRNLAQQIGRIKDFQQLFVISHDDSFEGFTDQVITLGEKR